MIVNKIANSIYHGLSLMVFLNDFKVPKIHTAFINLKQRVYFIFGTGHGNTCTPVS